MMVPKDKNANGNCTLCGVFGDYPKAYKYKEVQYYRKTCLTCEKTRKDLWRSNNKELHNKSRNEWQKRNLWCQALRRNKVRQATPNLNELDILFLDEIYDLARRRNLQVDHIIPLVHPLVCGLHVPQNLRLLPQRENAIKSNKWENNNGS